MPTKPSLFLTGFMGVGKSTVALSLAKLLDREAVDTDSVIQKECGQSISEIFAKHGEKYFRELEKKALGQIVQTGGLVVSLGGGALINPETLTKIKESGILVYLRATPETLENRLRDEATKRPLLAGLDQKERMKKIAELLTAREASYYQATITVDTDMLTPEKIAYEIKLALEK